MRRLLTVGVFVVAALGASAGPALAHAELVAVEPGPTAGSVVLLFSEAIDLAHSELAVDGVAQALHPLGPDSLEVRLPNGLSDVTWRMVSADDGHSESGARVIDPATVRARASSVAAATSFVGASASAADPAAASTDLLLGARIAQYAALVVLLGGLAFLAMIWPAGASVPRARKLLATAALVGLGSAVLGVGLQQATLTDSGPGVLGQLATWRDAAQSHVGEVWTARALLWLLTVPLVRALSLQGVDAARSRSWRVACVAVSAGLVRTIDLTSHGAASVHPLLGAVADVVHLLAASLWLGGLVFLVAVVLPRREPLELARVLPRYSLLALGSVTTAVAAGIVLSWDLVGSVGALLSTGYGHRLLIKVGLVLLLLLAAQRSKSFVQSRLDVAVVLGGDRLTLRPLLVSVGAEALIAAAVLSAAAVLATTGPVR